MDFNTCCVDHHPPTHDKLLVFEVKAVVSVIVYACFSRAVHDATLELVTLLRSLETALHPGGPHPQRPFRR